MLEGLPAIFEAIQGEGEAQVQSHQRRYSFHGCKTAAMLHDVMVNVYTYGDLHCSTGQGRRASLLFSAAP